MAVLTDIKSLLQISGTEHDAILNICISEAEQRIKSRINAETVPAELEHITRYIAMARYNMIGSEGISSENSAIGSTVFRQISDEILDSFKDELRKYGGAKRLVVL